MLGPSIFIALESLNPGSNYIHYGDCEMIFSKKKFIFEFSISMVKTNFLTSKLKSKCFYLDFLANVQF